ncbi:MAG: hypothetical protein IKD03_02650 [Clostridia bacterium]|nr:hypothetical protein [Clostridia bacterium]
MKNLRGHKKSSESKIGDTLRGYGFDEKKVNDYASMSEERLIEELIKSVKESKKNGTFDAQKIQTFASIVAPRLDENGRKKLQKLLKEIT